MNRIAFACLMLWASPARPQNALPPKAFSLEQQEMFYGKDSETPSKTVTRVVARRSDGAYMTSFTLTSPAGESGTAVEIWDVPSHKYVTLEPFTKSAMTWYKTDAETTHENRLLRGCSAEDLAALKSPAVNSLPVVVGHPVVPLIERNGGDRAEIWIAPDLDCYPLKQMQYSSRGSHNEITVTKIQEGDPAASLFAVPRGYVERSPGEADALYSAKYQGRSLYGQSLESLNRQYFEHRPKRQARQ